MVFRTGLEGGLGSRSFGIDSSHREVLMELDLEIFDDPVSNNWSRGVAFKVVEDGAVMDIVACVGHSFETLLCLVEEFAT